MKKKKGRREGRNEKNDRNKKVEKGRNNCLPKPRIKNMLIFIYDKLGKKWNTSHKYGHET